MSKEMTNEQRLAEIRDLVIETWNRGISADDAMEQIEEYIQEIVAEEIKSLT